uniref:Transmembrane protein 208 n=2 Tax=Macrostomum lignano TaxID=282301 RepID=A0A1I8GFZ8_9PLAT
MKATTKPGKTATRGQKQITEENASTLQLYQRIILGVNAFALPCTLLFWSSISNWHLALIIVCEALLGGMYKVMSSMSAATYSPTGQLVDAGQDLNMEHGMAEHFKDVLLWTAGTLVLAQLHTYCFCLLIAVPIRLFYLLWVNILGPWFFAPAPEETEADAKKQKKQERRMNRAKIVR